MRTREEIESATDKPFSREACILEVLLDIRDLLVTPPPRPTIVQPYIRDRS